MDTTLRDLARARDAFNRPTLALLSRRKWAPLILAVFASHFSTDRPRISAEQFHVQVDTALDLLRQQGEDVPDGSARDLCRSWVADQWLSLAAGPDNIEVYALTSHAQDALDYVTRLAGDRPGFSESRIRTILDTAHRCATEANPDPEERIRRLDAQIERLTAQRDRIAAGEEPLGATDDQMLDEYVNLANLLAALPADFTRVVESMDRMRRDVLAEFRAEARSSGEVLDDYLDRAEALLAGSAEGRAFTGAVDLLRDDRLLAELRADLEVILAHPFSVALALQDKASLRATPTAIRSGMQTVLDERRRMSGALNAYMHRHDALRERELDNVLREVSAELTEWMATARPRDKADLDLPLRAVDVGHLRTRMFDPGHRQPPDPIESHDEEVETLTLEEIRQQGGPTFGALREAVLAGLDRLVENADEGVEVVTADTVFAALPEDLRRPVEILGMIHLAALLDEDLHSPAPASARATYDAIRPDGRRVRFTGPVVEFGLDHLAALMEESLNDGDSLQREEPLT